MHATTEKGTLASSLANTNPGVSMIPQDLSLLTNCSTSCSCQLFCTIHAVKSGNHIHVWWWAKSIIALPNSFLQKKGGVLNLLSRAEAKHKKTSNSPHFLLIRTPQLHNKQNNKTDHSIKAREAGTCKKQNTDIH